MANTQPHNTTFSKVTATEFKFPMNWSHGRACNLLNSTNPTKCSMYTPNVFMPITWNTLAQMPWIFTRPNTNRISIVATNEVAANSRSPQSN